VGIEVLAITDNDGNVVEANIYGPFGETEFSYKTTLHKVLPEKRKELLVDPFLYSSDNRYTYTGQEQDEFGGLIYYNARWYDPEIGRFISEDPAPADPNDPLSINRYIYCRNNPLVYVDPTGELFAEILSFAGSIFGPLGTAIGGIIGGILDAAIVNYAVSFAVNEIAGAMERSGDKRGAQFLRNAYTAYTVISTVVSVINVFESVAKTTDGVGSETQADINQGTNVVNGNVQSMDNVDVAGIVTEPGVYTEKFGLDGLSFTENNSMSNIRGFLDEVNSPIGKISSGYRTDWRQWELMTSGYDAANPFWRLDFYNGVVSSYSGGFHQQMKAFDVIYNSAASISNEAIISAANNSGFGGVGRGWVHLDYGPKRSWSYAY
jgi:RHS repeat-associated protein